MSGLALNKFSTVKKSNQNTHNHWPVEKHPQKGKGHQTPKTSGFSGNKKKWDKKGKSKEKAKESLNVLSIVEVPELSTFHSESNDFSCYVKGGVVEWLLDSGCTEHVTPVKSDLHSYREFNLKGKAEITDRKYINIKGMGMVIRYLLLPDDKKQSMLMSKTTRWGTIVSHNDIPFIIQCSP